MQLPTSLRNPRESMAFLAPSLHRSVVAVVLFLAGSAVFAAAYGQAPLYYSNQNQYFLHGLADAGSGYLKDDWLAQTRDPTPVFTGLVAFTARYLRPWAFYLEYALVMGVYGAAMLGLFAVVAGQAAARRWPIFLALLILVHSALLRWYCYRWLGQDYPWFLQSGLANQYILGATLQPSVFGVFLVAAICLFVRGHPYLAAVSAALAGTLHFTYLLQAGLVVLGFVTVLLTEKRYARALAVGALSLALVLPSVLYVSGTFAPTSTQQFARASEILVDFRIPRHCRPELFMDGMACLQLAWVVLGIALAGGKRLGVVLAVPALLAMLLSLAQAATGSRTLALLFPWRISAILVPIATTIILSRLVAAIPGREPGWLPRSLAVTAIIGLMVGGVWICVARQGYHISDDELPLLEFVRQTRRQGDLYLIPVNVPAQADSPRGTPSSSDFKPLAAKKRDALVIPVDLQRFRLATGVPIFVDFKAIPYKDTDVLEWYKRLRFARSCQQQMQAGHLADTLAVLRRQRITHLVVPAAADLKSGGIEQVYADAHYRIYRLLESHPP